MKNIMEKIKDFMIGPEFDEEDDYIYEEEEIEETPVRPVKDVYTAKTVKRGSSPAASTGDKIVSIHTNVNMEVVIAYPKVVDDTSSISEHLKDNKTVVVNLEGVDREETQRIVDFLSGVAYALDGEFQSISNRIFIAAPRSVNITGQFKEDLKSSGIIFPWVTSAMK